MSNHTTGLSGLSGLGSGNTPLANQVAGHQNVLSDSSGSLVIKVYLMFTLKYDTNALLLYLYWI